MNLECVFNDQSKVDYALRNVLTNAVKYTEKGKISLAVKAINNEIQFTIKDSGKGISQKDQSKIFDAYQQLDLSYDSKYGSGLGLAITKKMWEALDGKITLKSALGKGTTFSVHLPLQVS